MADFWDDAIAKGIIQGDKGYYSSGKATQVDFENAIRAAFKNTNAGSVERKAFIDWIWSKGGGKGDKSYWYTLTNESPEVSSLVGLAPKMVTAPPATTSPSSGQDFWSWASSKGLIEGDPSYYSSGKATTEDYSNAITKIFQSTNPGSAERKALVDWTFKNGNAQGDPAYWYNLASNSPEITALAGTAKAIDQNAGGIEAGTEVKALPRNSRLVNVAGQLRVIWDLGDGLGSAWYSINSDQLNKLYGDNWNAYVTETFGTEGAYTAKYGDYHWGNVAEIDIASDNPWEDLKARTFEAFGYVAGFDDPEVKRIILQGHFESWSPNEFAAHYQQTNYFRNTTETQRAWGGYGPEEQAQRKSQTAADLVERYRSYWGVDPIGGTNNPEILAAAERIASGQTSIDQWQYETRKAAEAGDNTPAARAVVNEQRAQGEAEVTMENRGGFARERWEYWMGSTPVPPDFVSRWGRDLFMNTASEDDLETSLRELSAGTWQNKPENIGWSEWAAPVKSNIKNLLELTSVDDNDSLLKSILNQGLSGNDASLAIRKDQRFKSTNRMFEELSQSANALGRTFGFIA
jgi:hypothetical protein